MNETLNKVFQEIQHSVNTLRTRRNNPLTKQMNTVKILMGLTKILNASKTLETILDHVFKIISQISEHKTLMRFSCRI